MILKNSQQCHHTVILQTLGKKPDRDPTILWCKYAQIMSIWYSNAAKLPISFSNVTRMINKNTITLTSRSSSSNNVPWSHLPILLCTVNLVLLESSSLPLCHILGIFVDRGVQGCIVCGLPWDINCRFSSAQHR